MTRLCDDCVTMIAFRWSDQPCASCAAREVTAATISRHECDTLMAFGWTAAVCTDCRGEGTTLDIAA